MAAKKIGNEGHTGRADNLGILSRIERPLKVVFLGAGSAFFKNLFIDVMNVADTGEMILVDIDKKRLDISLKLGRKVVDMMGKNWKINATTQRLQALKNTDYIINCIEVSGTSCVRHDNDIPLKYGVNQCIGDTIGPGGLFKALRTVPVFLEILKDIERLCPNALILNYTNPMSIMCLAAHRASKARMVGLCHGVQHTSHELAKRLDVPYSELEWECAGVNHLAWFTKLAHKGKDLYPELKKKVRKDRKLWEKDAIRFDVMEHFGYFITESSGHDSEYMPYYRKRPDLIKKYCFEGYLGETSYYADNWPKWRKLLDEQKTEMIVGKKEISLDRTWEYASWIIEAIETNAPFVGNVNVPNTGLIDNLPQNGIVEVATVFNRNGHAPTHYGSLPPQCAALCASNMAMFELATIACLEKSKEAAIHSLMVDPLTAAVCSPAEIKAMTLELFDAEKEYLPKFK